jgi:hypothetical protein
MRLGLAFSLATILVFSIVSANPVDQRRQTGNEAKFRLKTGGSSNIEHNNLYVESYHTGAGASDAVLAGLNTSAIFFLNGTNAQYDAGTPFPWGINLEGDTNYAEWEFVTLNPGYGSGKFFINSTGLQWTGDEFGGWLACDWWHGYPQLFWIVSYGQPTFPSSCSKVNLEIENL